MQAAYSGLSGSGNFTGMSLDGIFLLHFLQALDRLQVYLGEGGEDEEQRWMRVNLQFQYCLHLLPRDKQDEINRLVDAREQELKRSKVYSGAYTASYIARMLIVTEIVGYLTSSLDLVHEDIIASLTPRAKEHAISAGEAIQIV